MAPSSRLVLALCWFRFSKGHVLTTHEEINDLLSNFFQVIKQENEGGRKGEREKGEGHRGSELK